MDSSNHTLDLQEQLEQLYGAKRESLYSVIPFTIIYVAIFVFGIIGNVCTCVVVTRNRYMHTATNYYLFNLAVSDFLLVIIMPVDIYQLWSGYPWIFGVLFCKFRAAAAEMSAYVSILTITAFTIERYVAIVHPIKCHTVSSLSRAIKIIVVIWISSIICSIPFLIQFGLQPITVGPSNNLTIVHEHGFCGPSETRIKYTLHLSTFLFFLIPMSVITVLYILIGMAVRRSVNLSRSGSSSSGVEREQGHVQLEVKSQQFRARRAVLKMLGKK